ncbi:transcription factor bHLH90-like isoform X1 [Camellia sinensis]|uniref:transcription factor bHLH90-like isoform X1 n=2 Tax=Camellia sinensis TaxID=4442 RepID=UPI0010363B9B|nr:transcription factor bHLH90-like isoform X1 [Camellia sinensis]
MSALETALHWLRPLVESNTWDYCVVWKLGNDPSRFIQWVGCCCAGACACGGELVNVKEESGDQKHHLFPLCRDCKIKHSAKTKACEKLSHFPSSMALYSGIHGEVVMSTEARWIRCAKDSNSSDHLHVESTGTELLIPVVNGLIELFSTKHIPKDEKIVDFITSQFNINIKRESVTAQSYSTTLNLSKQPHDPLVGEYFNSFIPRLPFLSLVSQPATYPCFEGSSTGSSPSNQHSSFCSGSGHVSPNVSVNESIEKYPPSKKQEELGILGHANHLVEKDSLKSKQRIEREQYQSKNLVTERKRRNRIKDGLFTLRSLVPKISKMDRASILGDAIEYIEDLQKAVKKLQDELREMEKEKFNEESDELEMPKLNASTEHNQDPSTVDENEQMEEQVEVKQIGMRNFLLKLLCKRKQGGFRGLIEAVNSLGLQVIDANVTTFNGKVLNILQLEVNKLGVEVQQKSLRDSLIKLTGHVASSYSFGGYEKL